MRHPLRIVGAVIGATMTMVLAFTALSAASGIEYHPGQVIVKFSPQVGKVTPESRNGPLSVGIASLDQRLERYGVYEIGQIFPHKRSELSFIHQINFDPQYDARAVARDFGEDQHLLYAEPRYYHQPCDTPNDPYYLNGLQWFFDTVQAPEAWDITHGDSSVIIGIVDTGMDWDHPDLIDNRWINLGEDANGNGIIDGPDWNDADDDSNGFIDDFYGWDFAGLGYPDNLPDEGAALHGTHTAGVCGGVTNNGLTCAGMSWNCTIMPVKVSEDGSYEITHGYEGIQYATDNGAQVINLSWRRGGDPSAFEQEIIDSAFAKGAILVAAAGNDEPGSSYAPPDTCPFSYPAVYSHVTAVAATDIADKATAFTYYGTWVDVSAPGNAIYSHLWNNSYGLRGSTSGACALVSGVAALLRCIEPDMNSDQFEARVQTTAEDIDYLNPTYAGWLGGGRLNAYRALMNIVPVEETWAATGTVPADYALSQNYPNPFNPNTTISYKLPVSGQVALKIYNVRGQLVRTLVEGIQPAGEYAARWDGCDRQGHQVTSGIYICCLKVDNWSQSKRMVLLR
jgi:subtilisin family serine protease